ncbi:MAG: SurA N-terminal domain-containing protein [Gallionellaceae bacterium]|jgi:peptidyl-prolyl cis-trans isomerase D
MFDFVQEKKRVVQVVLILIIITFGFFGVESYRQSGGGGAPATVNGEKISQQEFDNALRQQQERVREQAGPNFDPALFDKPEIKNMILDSLVNQRLLSTEARSAGLTLSDVQLAQIIAGIDAFQKDGKFDKQQYETALRVQGMTPVVFESRVRDELSTRQLVDAYSKNGYASRTGADNLIRLNEQQRVVSVAQLSPEMFSGQVTVDDAAVKEYYEKNQKEFQTPERARVEYLIFSVSALLPQIKLDDAEIRKYYEENKTEFSTPELRKAAHILIAVDAKASDAEKQAARVNAEQILQQVREAPAQFSQLARKYSQDPGSAENGGDLGMFGRGMMVKPFDEAVFKLIVGEVSGLVQTDFGFHIIKLLAVKGGKVQALNEVRGTIVQKLRTQKANEIFAELAEKFSNTVYEQSDTLKPAAELVNLPVQQVAWLSKGQIGVSPWTDKALQAVFSDEVVKNKRNTPAIEIAPNTLLAARILEHKPESVSALDEVASSIRKKLQRQRAQDLAIKQGSNVLSQLQQGASVSVGWKAAQSVTRSQHTALDNEFTRQIFKADISKLPAYVGMESAQGGYMLARIDSVKELESIDESKRARYMQQLSQMTGEELLQAFIADTKQHASITVVPFVTEEKIN